MLHAAAAAFSNIGFAVTRGHQHYILWAGENDEESGRWFFAPAAFASQKGPDGKRVTKRQAALWLLEAFWRGQHLPGFFHDFRGKVAVV